MSPFVLLRLIRAASHALSRIGVVLAGVVAVGLVAAPAAHAVNPSAHLTLAPGQSGSIGRVTSNTDVTPVWTCDTGYLSVSYDATMMGTVTVASDATLGSYFCTVDFQISGQSTGLVEDVSVDVVPGLSISDAAEEEGDTGLLHTTDSSGPGTESSGEPIVHAVIFGVTLSVPSASPVTVTVATADGTATAPSDYTAVSTTVTFQPGETTAWVGVTFTPDDTVEPDETFSVNLSGPTGAAIIDGQGIGTILNDDHSINT